MALATADKLPHRLNIVRQKHAACPRCEELVEAPGLCGGCQQDIADEGAAEAWWQQQEAEAQAEMQAADCPF